MDHVLTYKLPKNLEKLDADRKKLMLEGCAPKPIQISKPETEEESADEVRGTKKEKKKKKKKKKEKKKKKKRESSSTESESEEEKKLPSKCQCYKTFSIHYWPWDKFSCSIFQANTSSE